MYKTRGYMHERLGGLRRGAAPYRAVEIGLMIEGVSVFALVIVAFIVVTVLMGVRQVPQGYNYTVERFGHTTRL